MPHKILIVEDNDYNCTLLCDLLNYHGYEVAMASDGQKGVNLARELFPDLILIDIKKFLNFQSNESQLWNHR